MGEMRNAYKILVGEPEGKRTLGRPRCRCEDIIVGLTGIGFWGLDWIQMVQDRDWWRAVVNTVMSFCVP
jgi:hypothetical protein